MEENSKGRTRRSTGRKPKTDPAVFRYGIKLTSEENGKFELLFEKSGMKQRARFIKSMIFGREMKVVRIDKAAMDYYIRLTNFYHQFQAIGNNYN
ncbi:MAG: MobA protein, partial [Bacteroidetes bacterium]|nr:MobA protein [Candidatus Cryptobacteroides faecavium]